MQVSKHKDKQVIYKYIFSNGYLPDSIASTRRESTVKYLHIFYSSKVAIVFIILQIFFTTRTVLKDGEDHAEIPQFLGHIQSRDAFRPIAWEQKCLLDYKLGGCLLRGTANVQRQISKHIFKPNGGHCVYCLSNIFRNIRYLLKVGKCYLDISMF